MEQSFFSNLMLDFLNQNYPGFLPVKYFDDGSFECELKSPGGQFAMWIATCNSEITYGLESPDGMTDIHSHISCYEMEDLPDCLSRLTKWIESVKSNSTVIYLNDSKVWDWIGQDSLSERELRKGKSYQKYYWKEP